MKSSLLLGVLAGLFVGCTGYSFSSSPLTPVIAASSQQVVVELHYVRLYEKPDTTSPVLAILRQGAIVPVLTRSLSVETNQKGQFRWYRVRKGSVIGWVSGEEVYFVLSIPAARIYSSWILQDSL